MAHRTADAILEFTTGVLGPFDSRIAFVSNRGGFAKEIHTFTFDGAVTKITNHRTVTMAPSWSPDASSIVFTSFRGGSPTLNSIDIRSKAEKKLATKMGINVGGIWRPDGRSLAVAREEGVGVLVRVPHASGLLEGRVTADTAFAPGDHRNWRVNTSEKRRAWLEEGLQKVETLRFLESGRTLGQAAIQFILEEPSVASVLPNIYDAEGLRELATYDSARALGRAEIDRIEALHAADYGLAAQPA